MKLYLDTHWRLGLMVGATAVGLLLYQFGRPLWVPLKYRVFGQRTVDDVLSRFGPTARARLAPHFEEAGVAYPPRAVTLLGLKEEGLVEVWVDEQFVRSYSILGQSGVAGPKLREGDRQVPEGLYRIAGLNPNSSYHLSMKVNYPNEADLAQAALDGRDQPGSDIFIHGSNQSIGCLAMGDEAIEELFVLVTETGEQNVSVILAPRDPRQRPLSAAGFPDWVAQRYREIELAVEVLRVSE